MTGAATDWSCNARSDLFPTPLADYASTVMPESQEEALRWCEYIALNNGIYSSAVERVVSYFLTEPESADPEESEDDKQDIKDYLYDSDFIGNLKTFGKNFLYYGNTFVSVLEPFRRYLQCKGCRKEERPLSVIRDNEAYRFEWQGPTMAFVATCPKCKYRGPWIRHDRRQDNAVPRVKFWNPHHIKIEEEEYTGICHYIWKIPSTYRRAVREGRWDVLENCPWEVMDAVRSDMNIQFSDDFILHIKEEPLAGQNLRGWGMSRVISNFRQAWYVQVLHRFNEAIAGEAIWPIRVLSPATPTTAGTDSVDPWSAGYGSDLLGILRQAVAQRRSNPGNWCITPVPVNYQLLGGEGKNLAPFELLDQSVTLLLNNLGIPIELHKGNLQTQAAPASLRLFEAVQQSLVHGNNVFLNFVIKRVCEIKRWKPVKYRLARVTIIDDLNEQTLKLQLIQNQLVSETTALAGLGLNRKEEIRKIIEEQRYRTEQEAKFQQEQEASQMGEQMAAMSPQGGEPQPGQPAPGGQPAQGGAPPATLASSNPNQPKTPEELLAQAQDIAASMQLLPEGQVQGEMMRLKQRDPTLWMAVRGVRDDMRQQDRTQGAQMIQQQRAQQAQTA